MKNKGISKKIRKEFQLIWKLQKQFLEGAVLNTQESNADISVYNGVVCYDYPVDNFGGTGSSLNLEKFYSSLVRKITITNEKWFAFKSMAPITTIDDDLLQSHHGRNNMYDYANYISNLVKQMGDYLDTPYVHNMEAFHKAWLLFNDLDVYLDEAVHNWNWNNIQILGHQLASALFSTVYEYYKSGILVMVDYDYMISLPDFETFCIVFADYCSEIMGSTLTGDDYEC